MARIYIFADETGNFDFSGGPGASRYFGVGTLVLFGQEADALRADLHGLRIDLAWDGHGLDSAFHASDNPRPMRRKVLDTLRTRPVQFAATLIDKRSGPLPLGHPADVSAFRFVWESHLRGLLPALCRADDELMVVVCRSWGRGELEPRFGGQSKRL